MLSRLKNMLRKDRLKRPLYVTLFVTNRCNSRCIHCFNWREQDNWKDELTLKEIDGIMEQLGHLEGGGVSGGEPFLREDLVKIEGSYIKHCGIKEFGIPTNSLLPKLISEKSREMLETYPDVGLTIHLSLDGIGKMHDDLRGVKGNFDKVLETYRLLSELKKTHPKLSIKFDTTLSSRNISQMPELAEYVGENMPDADFHSFEIVRGDTRDKSVSAPAVKELRKLKKVIFGIATTKRFYPGNPIASMLAISAKEYIYDLYLKTLEEKKPQVPCYVGKTHAVIDSHGNVYFCELTGAIGNLRENTFDEIWNSEKAEKMREFIKAGKCWCVHSCFMQNNVVFTPGTYPGIMAYFLRNLLGIKDKGDVKK